MPATALRWTHASLDELRKQGDPLADESLNAILPHDEPGVLKSLFRVMNANDEVPPRTIFPNLAKFFEATSELPANVDLDRVHRGEHVFIRNVYLAALVLLTKSLPEGYAAPNLSIILNISGQLRTHPYRRLLATLQTVLNVSSCHGFEHGGRAVITAQKLRLLHAGIRFLTCRYRPEYPGRYGVPVNQEDMLGTILGFSLLVLRGLRTLKVAMTRQEEEDFLYLWLVFARMMGIHPESAPGDLSYIPDNVDDAEAFYRLYEERHYVGAAENPDGVALGLANLQFLERLVPDALGWLGFKTLPRIYMQELMGGEAIRRIGIEPVRGRKLLKWLLLNIHRLLSPFRSVAPTVDGHFGMMIFQGLINASYGGEVTFTVPVDLQDLKEITKR
jgi:hypothetical protein